jgi:hypothetical protein
VFPRKFGRTHRTIEAASLASKIKILLARPTNNPVDLRDIRTQFRHIFVHDIVRLEYRSNDVALYHVQFSGADEIIILTREQLFKYRPRGYIVRLKELYKRHSFDIDQVLSITTEGSRTLLLCKFRKYPQQDAAWISLDDITTGKSYLERLITFKEALNKTLIGTVSLKIGHPGPNSKLFNTNQP